MKKITLFLFATIYLTVNSSSQPTKENVDQSPDSTLIASCYSRIDSIVNFALKQKGATYKYGAAGPKYFDCSGLVYYTFNHFGIKLFRSSRDQYTHGIAIKKEEIQRGDLVFFKRGQGIGHVGIVTETDVNGDYYFIHASTYKRGICIDHSSKEGYATTFVGARRIIICDSIPQTESMILTIDSLLSGMMRSDLAEYENSIVQVDQPTISEKEKEKESKTTVYTVKKGDSLYGISKKYKVTIGEIKKWNNLSGDKIRIGQKLKIKKK